MKLTKAATAKIDKLIGKMSLEDKVGQCLTLNQVGYTLKPFERSFIEKFRCGGLRLTPHITGVNDEFCIRKLAPHVSPAQYATLLNELQEIAMERNGIPLHMVVDQEGDLSIDVLRGGLKLFPSNMGMTAAGDKALVRNCFQVIARQLRAFGIHWIHSPEVDVNVNPNNPEIGMRAYSDDPQLCAEYGLASLQGLTAGGIVGTLKHFPGRGDSEIDAHDDLDVLRVDRQRLDDVELLPYRALIKAGAPAIMTAHNAYPALDDTLTPASVSYKITTGVLREELGFNGVITTDAIGMKGLLKFTGGQAGATVMAIKAGADLVLVKEDEATTRACFEALLAAVKNKEISEARLEQSVRRILTVKAQFGFLDDPFVNPKKVQAAIDAPANQKTCRKIFEKATFVVRDRQKLLPLPKNAKVLAVEPFIPIYHMKCNDAHYHPGMFYEWMQRYSDQVVWLETESPASDADVKRFRERVKHVEYVAFFNVFWRGSASNRPLIREAVKLGKKVVLATNDLYDSYFMPTVGTVLCTFGAVPEGSKMAADVIFGKAKGGGRWPLKLVKQGDMIAEDAQVDRATTGHFAKL